MRNLSKTLAGVVAVTLLCTAALAQNDECAGALPLPMGQTAYDTTTATTSMPAWPCASGGNDLWYQFTAPQAANYTVDTCTGTSYDSALEVFSGPCAALVSIDCNDDTCGTRAAVSFPAMAGEVFFVRVGGWNSNVGTGLLTVTDDLPVLNPANGHYYLGILANGLPWDVAQADAQAMIFQGVPGNLASVTSAAEKDFIVSLGFDRPWLGGFQNLASPSYSEPLGGWEWVTGEPFTYMNWSAGEPNNNGPGGVPEDHMEMFGSGVWNDIMSPNPVTSSYIVEWDTAGGGLGTNYCGPAIPNSTGMPGVMSASGSIAVAANNVTLTADQMTADFGYFLNSMTQGFFNPPASNGILCLSGAIGRYNQPGLVQPGPSFSITLDLGMTPTPVAFIAIQPGETWNFQAWYRDTGSNNFTDGLSIGFL